MSDVIDALWDAVMAIPSSEMTETGPIPRTGEAVKDDVLGAIHLARIAHGGYSPDTPEPDRSETP